MLNESPHIGSNSLARRGIILWTLLFPALAFSQISRSKIDSLQKVWYSTRAHTYDTTLLQAGSALIVHYQKSDYDSMYTLCMDMLTRGHMAHDTLWINTALFRLAHYHFQKGNHEQSINLYQAVISQTKQHEDLHYRSYNFLGRNYRTQSKYDKALVNYEKALSLAQNTQDKAFINEVYLSIAGLYYGKNNFLEALKNYQQVKMLGLPHNKLLATSTCGLIFKELGFTEEVKSSFDESLSLYRQLNEPAVLIRGVASLIQLAPSLRSVDTLLQKGLMLADSFNLPRPSMRMYLAAGKYYLDSLRINEAVMCLNRALDQADQLNQDDEKAKIELYLAKGEHLCGQYTRSLKNCRKIKSKIEKYATYEQVTLLYGLMSQNFEALGRFDSALYYIRKKHASDDQANVLKQNIRAYLQYKYEQDARALQDAKTYAENLAAASGARERLAYWLFGVLTLFIGIIALFYFIYYRQKNQAALQLSLANQALQSEQEKLRRSNEKLRHFSGVVSHDILSSLDLILSTGNILVNPKPQLPQLTQYYDLSQLTSRQLKNYCLNLLEEATTIQEYSDSALQDPNPVLKDVLQRFDRPMRAKNMRINADRLAPLALPAVLMEQIFQNLISNALRYASEGADPTLHFRSERDESGRSYWIIEDNGPGISENTIRSIQEGKAVNSEKGQGVGLVQLSASLREYGATLNLETRPEGGIQFIIKIP